MGLGKTPTVLAHIARTAGDGPVLVIAPPAVVGNWAAESARFTPGLRVVVHHGASRATADELDAEELRDSVLAVSGDLDPTIGGPGFELFRFKDEADVIAMCNNSPFGLASYFYSRDLGRVWRVAEALESGMVGVNTGLITTEVAPFGGVKESGLGREGSRHGMEEYVEIKYVMMAGV